HLLCGICPNRRVGAGEGAVLEDRMIEEVCRGHGGFDVPIGQGLLEVAEDLVALRGGRTKWNDIVVVELEAVTIALGQAADRLKGGKLGAGHVAKRIPAAVLQAPAAEREFVLLGRCVKVRWHGMSLEQ